MNWYMLVLVGRDQTGIVARITQALFGGGANLGEASMIRLGGNFTMMLMVNYPGDAHALAALAQPVADAMGLTVHIDPIRGELHRHAQPNVSVSVHGADRAGIVARVTTLLSDAGLNILNLESDVGGTEQQPIYVMHIDGSSDKTPEELQALLAPLAQEGIRVHVDALDSMVG
jgi:glycine cleavage system transcriptional repressor